MLNFLRPFDIRLSVLECLQSSCIPSASVSAPISHSLFTCCAIFDKKNQQEHTTAKKDIEKQKDGTIFETQPKIEFSKLECVAKNWKNTKTQFDVQQRSRSTMPMRIAMDFDSKWVDVIVALQIELYTLYETIYNVEPPQTKHKLQTLSTVYESIAQVWVIWCRVCVCVA